MAGLVRRLLFVVVAFGGLGIAAPAGAAPTDGTAASPQLSVFVIGDHNASLSSHVTFWGAQWAKSNILSGGDAPDSFKGFADTVLVTGCNGGSFTTAPGDSSEPPSMASGGTIIYVLVANTITKSGPVIAGTFDKIVAVQTDPGYGPDPGHSGTGVVIGPGPGCSDGGGVAPS